MSEKKSKSADDGEKCPQCGSGNIAGLMASFWASVDGQGGLVGQFSDYASETEIGPERLCRDCDHQFISDL